MKICEVLYKADFMFVHTLQLQNFQTLGQRSGIQGSENFGGRDLYFRGNNLDLRRKDLRVRGQYLGSRCPKSMFQKPKYRTKSNTCGHKT